MTNQSQKGIISLPFVIILIVAGVVGIIAFRDELSNSTYVEVSKGESSNIFSLKGKNVIKNLFNPEPSPEDIEASAKLPADGEQVQTGGQKNASMELSAVGADEEEEVQIGVENKLNDVKENGLASLKNIVSDLGDRFSCFVK